MSTIPSTSTPAPAASLAADHAQIFERLQAAALTITVLSERYRLSVRDNPSSVQSAVASQFVAVDYSLKYLRESIDSLRFSW